MSRIICVLLSLSMVFTFAETDNIKETIKLNSEIKLAKQDGLLQSQIKTTKKEFEKTIQRNLTPAKSKKEKKHIAGGLSKDSYQQPTPSNISESTGQDFKPEKVLAKSPAPTLVGPRPSIAPQRPCVCSLSTRYVPPCRPKPLRHSGRLPGRCNP